MKYSSNFCIYEDSFFGSSRSWIVTVDHQVMLSDVLDKLGSHILNTYPKEFNSYCLKYRKIDLIVEQTKYCCSDKTFRYIIRED